MVKPAARTVCSASLPDAIAHTAESLRRGCDALGLTVSGDQQDTLLDYLALLHKWNKAFNLTAVRDPLEMVPRHLLDSLAILPFLPEGPVLDVGTGAGLPGVPLAIMRPGQPIHLLDSNGKKTRFLFQVKTALALDNMQVHQARVESFRSEHGFAAITSRAFATLQDMLDGSQHLLADEGKCLAMKGTYPSDELDALSDGTFTREVQPLDVPGLAEARHLVILQPRRIAANV